jgi:thiol-disulfide isomerase/thioredoxin
MKTQKYILAFFITILSLSSYVNAQTTAYDFQGVDCNGNNVHLFSDLDAGQAIVLYFYMPNCGTCPPIAEDIQSMANKINAVCPDLVKGYAYPYQNSTTCAYSASWVADNALDLYIPMDSGAYQVAYYGGFGMPTVVLLGGSNHDVMWSTQNFVDSDTTVMRDLIYGISCLGVEETNIQASIQSVYPNPAAANCTVEFSLRNEEIIGLQIIDLTGKILVKKENFTAFNGANKVDLDVSSLASGSYFIRLTNGEFMLTEKLEILK